MSDRRQTRRDKAEVSCVLDVQGRMFPGTLVNLSEEGALFRLEAGEPGSLEAEDLGMDASFVLSSTHPARRYTGEMIRRYFLGGFEYVALRFWRKFVEI